MADDDVGRSDEVRRADDIGRTGPRITARHVVVLVLVGLLVTIAVLNLDDVSLDLIAGSIEMPLILVVVIAIGIGFAGGWAYFRRRERRQRAV